MKKLFAVALTSSLFLSLMAGARAAELGDAAAPLKIDEWVKGKPVTIADGKGKTIYVVEFWATWCPPCRTSIPHLTELQKKFKDKGVVFIGVTDEKSDKVKPFVEKQGDKMDYIVAIDKEGGTSEGYMQAYGINGIPHAFVVDKEGKVAWHGHPMADLEKTLEDMVAGKYNMASAKKRAQGQELLQKYYQLASKGDDEGADKVAKEIAALEKEVGGLNNGKNFDPAEVKKSLQFRKAIMAYQRAVMSGDSQEKVDKLAAEAKAVAPEGVDFDQIRGQLEMQSLSTQYRKAVTGKGDDAKAAELGKKLADIKTKNPMFLNELAWFILTDDSVQKRDLPLALKLAQSAYDVSEGQDAAITDTYARALFDNGKFDDAVKYQKKAVALAKDNKDMQEELEKSLKRYQEKAGKK